VIRRSSRWQRPVSSQSAQAQEDLSLDVRCGAVTRVFVVLETELFDQERRILEGARNDDGGRQAQTPQMPLR
jgi:hypothetical protein